MNFLDYDFHYDGFDQYVKDFEELVNEDSRNEICEDGELAYDAFSILTDMKNDPIPSCKLEYHLFDESSKNNKVHTFTFNCELFRDEILICYAGRS